MGAGALDLRASTRLCLFLPSLAHAPQLRSYPAPLARSTSQVGGRAHMQPKLEGWN